jgi:signal recognition particle subunit SRP54
MFDSLSDKLQRVFKNLRGEGKLTAENMEAALKEIRVALLEADVHFKVVKTFMAAVREKAMGQEVLNSFTPAQQVIKIVKDEMITVLGTHASRLRTASQPPTVIMIVGLQGSGKTTSTGKLAKYLAKNGQRPLVVSVDVYRPAARKQLSVVAGQVNIPVYEGTAEETKPLQLAKSARRRGRRRSRAGIWFWWTPRAGCTSTTI